MARRSSPTYDDDAPELTDAELAQMRPARDVLSPEEFAAVSSVRRGGSTGAEPKVPVTIRLDRTVVEAFKATGKGWQTKINDTLARSAVTGRFVRAEHGKTSAATTIKESVARPRKPGAKTGRA